MPGLASVVAADRRRPRRRARATPSGLMITSRIELNTPTSTPVTAPVVLNRRHVSASSSAGKLALAATAKARPTMNETFRPAPPMTAIAIAIAPIATAAMRGDADLLLLGVLALADDVRPHVVGHRARRRDHQARHHREDRGERHRGDDRQEQVAADGAGAAAELLGQQRRGQVAARARGLLAAVAEDRPRAEAEERGHHVEGADQGHRPHHRRARGLGVGHGEEPHQDVRQARGAEHQRQAERHGVERGVEEQARLEVGLRLSGDCASRLVEQLDRVAADLARARRSTARSSRSSAARP